MSVYLTLLDARSIQAPTPDIPTRTARAKAKTKMGEAFGEAGGGVCAMSVAAAPYPGLNYLRTAYDGGKGACIKSNGR